LGSERALTAIDHIGVVVRSVDAALRYFVDQLGLTAFEEEQLIDPPVRLAYLNAGNVFVQLLEPIGRSAIAEFLEAHGEGVHHICFRVPDIYAARAQLDAAAEGTIQIGGRGRRACFLGRVPFGVRIELVEVEAIGQAKPVPP
jgi:methylmalonyl-CoA/ethylmalonyl-CoA epimerase